MTGENPLTQIPSVDRLLSHPDIEKLLSQYGHTRVTDNVRRELSKLRQLLKSGKATLPTDDELAMTITHRLEASRDSSLVNVINLTGTVLHTNLGRAVLPDTALASVARIAGGNSNLEFDLERAARGDRDEHVERLVREITGAEAVTVVNNNAAAVLICLNTFAMGKEVCISRGELVEIGGSFRIPEVMEKSSAILREVGATNRTHLKDYQQAMGSDTGLLMKVHTSNYEIRGFTNEVSYEALANLAGESAVPMLADLGSGTLVNLEDYGLAHEPTVQEVLAGGADVVTFSGDKLLGGPQAGIIAGREDLIDAIKKNPLKRALRVDKMTMAALAETLKLYREPELLTSRLPTLRHLSRTAADLEPIAASLQSSLSTALGDSIEVSVLQLQSQIGSGALPLNELPSLGLGLKPVSGSDSELQNLADAFRRLPTPVIGRVHDGSLLFDLRTLDSPDLLINQLQHLQTE